MWSLLPLLIAVLFAVTAVQAQEQSPTPAAPESSPQASPSPSPAETPKDSSATPEATPVAAGTEAAPGPSATPSAGAPMVTPGDVIPMEGQPAAPANGAPLETKDLAPAPKTDEAMPDDAFTKPNAVIPDESAPQAPAAPPTAESAQEKARQVNIHYKEVRVVAEKDPKIVAMMAKADAAKSEEDRRAALREYYRMLFKKIVSMDASLTQKCSDLQAAYERRLAQFRLEPTIPLNPPPTPEPLSH